MMQIYQGKSVFEGIAIGRIRVYERKEKQVRRYYVEETSAQLKRLESAVNAAKEQLLALRERAADRVGDAHAAIFETHLLLLSDTDYLGYAENVIKTQMVNAEYAVEASEAYFCEKFSSMADEYMQARAADVSDVSERLIAVLTGYTVSGERSGLSGLLWAEEEPVILVAEDLAPSETVQLDKEKILGFVTVHGSVNSHTAILARTMNIPAIVNVSLPISELYGRMAVADGYSGLLYVDPDEETIRHMEDKRSAEAKKSAVLSEMKGKESVTLDGEKVALYANIGSLEDLKQALSNDAEGIGLFRSEFLYMGRNDYPSEEEQFAVYKAAAEAMGGKSLVIRTLDIGADKQAGYFGLAEEENPAMGCRAIRICLKRPELFETQLRAILRAAVYGKVAVLYPMITSLREIVKIRETVEQVKAELSGKGIAYGEIEQGIMIETPAAAVISDLLAKEVDFFSIGTNDLTQYMLAIDRQNGELDEFYDAYHESVLRMIEVTAENARKAGIRCGICGELAADTAMTERFLKIGIRELSVAPGRILKLRETVRQIRL